MPDDIITFGGPERRSRRDADEAVESLFHAHYPRVVYTAFSLVGDWDLAEQLAQEAYLRLWRRWRWISDPQAAPMYLQRTVVNLSRETIRRRVIERRVLRTRDLEPAAAPAPDAGAITELRRAVATLPMRKRECVVLRYLLGLSEAETADLLGISVGTVKSQTHKGLRQLRERLDDVTAIPGPGTGPARGSATGSARGPATGSARGPATGSARGPATGSARGSATGSARGPATGSARGPATGSAGGPVTGSANRPERTAT